MPVQLTQKDITDLKAQGFKDGEIGQAVKELEDEEFNQSYNSAKQFNDPRANASHSSFGTKVSDDIARWQLELNDILEKAEHVLKGDIVEFKGGQTIWSANPFPDTNTLNEFGVQLIMKCLSMYVNRNTILSDYTDEEIRYKVLDFGKTLNNLVFMKYEEMGLDTEDKRKEYPMLVREMVDIVHSAYARARDGGERESYRKMISVQQSNQNQMQGGMTGNTSNPQRTRGMLNPMRYVSGKYY